MPELHTRADWDARPSTGIMRPLVPARLTIHHTATEAGEDVPAALRAIQAFHQGERGWADIAYHRFVTPDGTIWEGRSLDFEGDSATDYDLAGHVHVALLGNFESHSPSDVQWDRTVECIEALSSVLNVRVVGCHSDYADTICPGPYVRHLVQPLRGADPKREGDRA